MRSVKMSQIEENIKNRRQDVNAKLQAKRGDIPRVKRKRARNPDERKALTIVTKASVERAKCEGKMKMTGKRRMFYDASE